MDKITLKHLIKVATGKEQADLCIKNARIIDVFNKEVFKGSIYIVNGYIAGFGDGAELPRAKEVFNANGSFISPGFINGHVYIESSHVSPYEYAKIVVPRGVTTAIADPHEMCNVCGLDGLDYMLKASEGLPLDVLFQVPSCVPATNFETSGAKISAEDIKSVINHPRILGLGELMDNYGVYTADDAVLDKVMVAQEANKIIDGHVPLLTGALLDAYSCTRVRNDHECTTIEEFKDRIRRGIYVIMREGSASHDLSTLLKAVNSENFSYCCYCTDDRQATSLVTEGDIDYCIKMALEEGVAPLRAISMATVNAARCFRLLDRGAIAPGLRADLVMIDNLKDFNIQRVWSKGKLVAEGGEYLGPKVEVDQSKVQGKMNVSSFSVERLALKLDSPEVRTIGVLPESITTEAIPATVTIENGVWVRDEQDIVKLAVVERHRGSGCIGLGLLNGYGLVSGAIANSVAHDSHNIICAGDNDADMALAINKLIEIGGGIVMVKDGKVIDSIQHEIAGIMTNRSAEWVAAKLASMIDLAYDELQVNNTIDPFMSLSFMALPVIPELRVTDLGLFDVKDFRFVSVTRDKKD